jgi:hypothetical protein
MFPQKAFVPVPAVLTAVVLTVQAGSDFAHAESSLPVREISADFNDLKGPRSEVWCECVGAGRASEGCLKMGAPRQLNRAQVSQLKTSASGAPEMENDVEVGDAGNLETSLAIRANDVWLVKMCRK